MSYLEDNHNLSRQSQADPERDFERVQGDTEGDLALARLNRAQRAAVETLSGPLLVLAGAGTGKTRVLTTRLALILRKKLCQPHQILAVTFTNKAAREMQSRLEALIGLSGGIWLGTFHRMGLKILRRHAGDLGFSGPLTILDQDDQLRLVKQILKSQNIDDKRLPPRFVVWMIQRIKDKGLAPEDLDLEGLQRLKLDVRADALLGKVLELYAARLQDLGAVDFGDLILRPFLLFQNNPEILESYRRQFHHILVDEYQDINVAQYAWLRLLAEGHGNICCVGDDDQAIYGWRGAEVDHILRFETDFPGATTVRLQENYRSHQEILTAASALIAHNQGRLGKTLYAAETAREFASKTADAHGKSVNSIHQHAEKSDSGRGPLGREKVDKKVIVQGLRDGPDEARFIASQIKTLLTRGHAADQIAILVRAGFQTREFEERFLATDIAYRVIGGVRFYDRSEVKDAIAYLRLARSSEDSLAFERVMNVPKRGFGATTLRALHQAAEERGGGLADAAESLCVQGDLRPQVRTSMAYFIDQIRSWQNARKSLSLGGLAEKILDESGYLAFWKNEASPEAEGRLENLREFLKALENFSCLDEFLEHAALVAESAVQDQPAVGIMTLHMAKGLEFETVFLAGWEEGLCPSQKTLEEKGQCGLEEERRLAYVGLTRARHQVWITFAWSRQIYGYWQSALPSRFIEELPGDVVDRRMRVPSLEKKVFASASRFSGQDRDGNDKARDALRSSSETSPFPTGMKVEHSRFGRGRVERSEGDVIIVAFEFYGTKKIMARFLMPA